MLYIHNMVTITSFPGNLTHQDIIKIMVGHILLLFICYGHTVQQTLGELQKKGNFPKQLKT